MIAAKMATPGLLKITVFWTKDYDVIITVDDVTNKILLRDWNYIVDMFMWQSLVIAEFLWGKLSQPQFYKDLNTKTTFLRGGLGSSSIVWDWH